jgi:hypothetical protein
MRNGIIKIKAWGQLCNASRPLAAQCLLHDGAQVSLWLPDSVSTSGREIKNISKAEAKPTASYRH